MCLVPDVGGDHAGAAAAVRPRPLPGRRRRWTRSPCSRSASNAVICGTNFTGMSSEDLPNAGVVSADLSRFPTMADRLQQGILNFMFLGRLMIHPQGLLVPLRSSPAGSTRERLFYAGASLGGIIGGALTAVAPDFDRSALIVPGLRFSLLLTRSTQFPTFGRILYGKYTDPVEQSLVNSFIQLLWDRGEANGYVYHMTRDPLPEHAAPRRCCCTRRSATTRCPTSRPRPRRASSARGCARLRSTRAAAATASRSTGSSRSRATRGRATRWRCSTSARCGRRAARRHALPRHAAGADHQPPPLLGVDPHDITAARAGRGVPVHGLPEPSAARFVDTCDKGKPCYAARLDGALSACGAWPGPRRARRPRRGRARGRRARPGTADRLRSDRPLALPVSVAERPLHGARQEHADRAARAPPGGLDARERGGQADRALRLQPRRTASAPARSS